METEGRGEVMAEVDERTDTCELSLTSKETLKWLSSLPILMQESF